MKLKTTAKTIRESTPTKDLISLGYCEAHHLLSGHQPTAYTCGIYGWNFDVYYVYGKTICTGYRGMPGRRPNVDTSAYEDIAKKLSYDYSDYDTKREKIEDLLKEFCEKA